MELSEIFSDIIMDFTKIYETNCETMYSGKGDPLEVNRLEF